MTNSSDSLRLTGLDTLSERALRRLVQPWTGELRSVDSLSVESAGGVADESTFGQIVEAWRRSRDIYADADVESVMGHSSSLSDFVTPLAEESATIVDTISFSPNLVEPAEALAQDSLSGPIMQDSISAVSGLAEIDSMNQVRYAEQFLQGVASMVEGGGVFWVELLLNLFVFGVLVGYMFCIYRYYEDVVALFSSVFSRSVISAGRVSERRGSEIFYGFLGKLFLLGAAFVGVLAMLSVVGGEFVDTLLTRDIMISVPLIAIAVFMAVIIFQYLELLIVGVVTRSLSEVFALMRLRLTYFVFFTVVAAPILLISQMSGSESSGVWFSLGMVATAMSLILYLRESLQFFIYKKISILHWILYLCTVEILPLTLLWQLVVRI